MSIDFLNNIFPNKKAVASVGAVFVFIVSYLASQQFFGISKDVEQYELFHFFLDSGYDGRFEPFFVLISILVKWLWDDFEFYVFLLTLFSLSLKFFLICKSRDFYINLLLYFLLLFPLWELTQYRVSIAASVAYLAFYLMSVNRASWLSVVLFVGAGFIHYSVFSLLPAVIYWLSINNGYRWSFVYPLFLLVVVFFLKSFFYLLVTDINSTLLVNDFSTQNIFSARNFVLFLVFLVGLTSVSALDKRALPYLMISGLGVVYWIFFQTEPIFANRLFELTIFSNLFWVGYLSFWRRCLAIFLLFFLGLYLSYRNIYIDFMFV